MEYSGSDDGLALIEGNRYTVLELPAHPLQQLVHAASGIVVGAPDSDGRTRAMQVLRTGGAEAVELAAHVVRRALGAR